MAARKRASKNRGHAIAIAKRGHASSKRNPAGKPPSWVIAKRARWANKQLVERGIDINEKKPR